LKYIPRDELSVKTKMCEHLGLRPLFIVRGAPKSYINEVRLLGGFTLVFKYQLYPFGQKAFADEVRDALRLPVAICSTVVRRRDGGELLNLAPRRLLAQHSEARFNQGLGGIVGRHPAVRTDHKAARVPQVRSLSC
jgi:hypothetical protein